MSADPTAGDYRERLRTAGVILAGGRSRRMGGVNKALLPLAGKPMLSHVIERVKPQVTDLALSVERRSASFDPFGLHQLPDCNPDGGPLGGLFTALSWMDSACDWLLLVPCDAPFVPGDLAEHLRGSAAESGLAGAVVRYKGEIQPTFSLWHRSILPDLEQAVTAGGMSGFKQFLRMVPLSETDWKPSFPPPFFNINDQQALLEANQLIKTLEEKPACSA